MNILAFDTCFGACSVALAWPDGNAARFVRMEKGHAERLLPMIEEVVAESPIRLADIGRIVVTRGPGTFTGVRIGIAAARALALATKASVAAASSLHLMAATALARGAGDHDTELSRRDIAVAVEARRDEIYFQLFGGESHAPLTAPLLVTPEQALHLLRDHDAIAAGSGAQRLSEAARRQGRALPPFFADLEPDARFLPGLAVEVAAGPPRPLYLRPPDARPQDGKSLPRTP